MASSSPFNTQNSSEHNLLAVKVPDHEVSQEASACESRQRHRCVPAATTGPTTPSLATIQAADAPMGEPGHNLEERLDQALQESMFTSDSVAIMIG